MTPIFALALAASLTEGVPPPTPGMAQIVVFREGDRKGSPISCALHEGATKLSKLPPRRFVVLPLTPGQHSLSVRSERTDTITKDFKADTTYYAECTIGAGILVERPHIHESNREAFMAELPRLQPVVP